ncbi:hypothetical protein AAVH_39069 [Aphelenchoides avenae]|nr:hypothetical protein AAVH_39069 [Aphelenchus avenae]
MSACTDIKATSKGFVPPPLAVVHFRPNFGGATELRRTTGQRWRQLRMLGAGGRRADQGASLCTLGAWWPPSPPARVPPSSDRVPPGVHMR